ncbi:hypothetical protein BT96DRAFT_997456 [Gymnopus androsaceus JB14]|uniref:Uncharacterized protein n=1 Tax=Gymnopus androsaceus JB14 TaxID=1447944 RepID=A0A6A4HCE0_9AGAR|nr:hypothetical protein BT96DRAFT_997456 [Gymnopus androsaceus JB14]
MRLSFSLRNLQNDPTPDAEGLQDIQNGVVRMFDTIRCPSLTSLSFSLSGFPISEIPFTNLPLDKLETLELNAAMSSKALYHCLALVPSLLSLQIRDIRRKVSYEAVTVDMAEYNNALTVDESVLLALSHGRAESDATNIPFAALTTFITSRTKTLKLCEAFFPSQDLFTITDDELGRLKAVKESGMMILRLHYSSDPPYPEYEQDLPTMGLLRHVQDPLPLMPQRRSGLSDMEGYWGASIIA